MTWKNYKYRFVPWILSNVKSKVFKKEEIQISEIETIGQIKNVCKFLEETIGLEFFERKISASQYEKVKMNFIKKFGFWIERQPSKLTNGGIGVIVTHGSVPINTLVGLYPGTVYKIGEPIFLQSIANSFVFRCADGTLIDGNDMGISKIIFRSCTFRDRIGPHLTSDMTWLTSYPVNPLNTGQYVNNHTQENPANVMYQEINLPLKEFPYKLRKFIPNVSYSSLEDSEYLRLVALVSIRNISHEEELYSSYFTMIE